MHGSVDYAGRIREAWLAVAAVLWASCSLVGCVGVIGVPGIGIKVFLGLFAGFAGTAAIRKGLAWRDHPKASARFGRKAYLTVMAELVAAFVYVGAASVFWADVLFLQCVLGIVVLTVSQVVRAAWGWLAESRRR